MDMVSCRTDAFFPGVHKIGAGISGPRIADRNFTDARIFLIGGSPDPLFACSKMSLFYLKTCTPVKATPEVPLEFFVGETWQHVSSSSTLAAEG